VQLLCRKYEAPPQDIWQPTDLVPGVGAPLSTSHTSCVDCRTLAGCRRHTWTPSEVGAYSKTLYSCLIEPSTHTVTCVWRLWAQERC